MSREIEVGDMLRSVDARFPRVVRVIEVHCGLTGDIRKIRVENVKSERRTFLTLPLRGWARHDVWHGPTVQASRLSADTGSEQS